MTLSEQPIRGKQQMRECEAESDGATRIIHSKLRFHWWVSLWKQFRSMRGGWRRINMPVISGRTLLIEAAGTVWGPEDWDSGGAQDWSEESCMITKWTVRISWLYMNMIQHQIWSVTHSDNISPSLCKHMNTARSNNHNHIRINHILIAFCVPLRTICSKVCVTDLIYFNTLLQTLKVKLLQTHMK